MQFLPSYHLHSTISISTEAMHDTKNICSFGRDIKCQKWCFSHADYDNMAKAISLKSFCIKPFGDILTLFSCLTMYCLIFPILCFLGNLLCCVFWKARARYEQLCSRLANGGWLRPCPPYCQATIQPNDGTQPIAVSYLCNDGTLFCVLIFYAFILHILFVYLLLNHD